MCIRDRRERVGQRGRRPRATKVNTPARDLAAARDLSRSHPDARVVYTLPRAPSLTLSHQPRSLPHCIACPPPPASGARSSESACLGVRPGTAPPSAPRIASRMRQTAGQRIPSTCR
eukprot:2261613-Rhodomonas_salina.1